MSSRKSPRQPLPVVYGVMIALLLATLLIYWPPYAGAFVGDDYVQLRYVRDFLERPFSAYQVFNPFWLKWYYRPLQNLWFLANRLVFGLNPFGYYYLQICLHLVAVALVYRVARQTGLGATAALAGAALFAIRDHHADVVAWISSIAIVLAAVFTLLALSSYLSYRRRPARHTLLLTALFFLLALLSHEEGFLLPPLLLFWRLEIGDWRLEIGNFGAISNLYSLISKNARRLCFSLCFWRSSPIYLSSSGATIPLLTLVKQPHNSGWTTWLSTGWGDLPSKRWCVSSLSPG